MNETSTSAVTQLHNLEAKQILNPLEELKNQLENLKEVFSTKTPKEFLSRKDVAVLLKTNPQTINNWTNEGKLQIYGIGGRRYYIRKEVEQALIKLN
tara:strand:- start:155 stop:445 length:291 start_codon:yes stop_codon:yes gene_type:complete